VESLRDSQQLANQIAKSIVINILEQKDNNKQLGLILKYIFSYETVLHPTRDLILWSILLPTTVDQAIDLLRFQRNYYMNGTGASYTSHQLLVLFEWWLLDAVSQQQVLVPLVERTIQLQTPKSLQPIIQNAADSIYNREAIALTTDALKWVVTESLTSESTKRIATDFVVDFLKASRRDGTTTTHNNSTKSKPQ